MKESFAIEKIYNCLSEEKRTGELISLPENFYKEASKYETDDKEEDKLLIKENHNKLLNTLKEKRIQKILIYLAYGRTLPSPIPEEETLLYNRLKSVLNQEKSVQKAPNIRILTEIPALMTPEGTNVGPFRKGEIVEIERESDRIFILRNKIGELAE